MVANDGRCFAMTPLLYREEMVKAFGDGPLLRRMGRPRGIHGALSAAGCEHLGIVGGKIAFNDGRCAQSICWPCATRCRSKWSTVFDILTGQRSRKDDEELEILRESSRIVDNVVAKLQKFIRPGMKERDVAKKIVEFFEEDGVTQMSFSPIVASGPNGSMPHYSGGDRVIQENDIMILDLGGRWKSYCSDTTRTFFTGTPTQEMRDIYEIVRRAQAAGEAAVQPGATGQDVDRAARQVIIDAGYGKYFFNRVGHGVGVAVHEGPYMIEGNTVPLEPGNVFSVEPGIYIPGKFGVRIENLVAVRKDGTGEALNHFTRDITICGE